MRIEFYKYQGTGNDFIIIDNRLDVFPKSNTELVARLCDRKFGIGADGLLLLEEEPTSDFRMVYFNSDGNLGSMCGNGGRCIVAFAKHLGLVQERVIFMASDGMHEATIIEGAVSLHMIDVKEVRSKSNSIFLNTGSPHHVQMVDNLNDINVKTEGAKLRYGLYGEKGSNINYVTQLNESKFSIRTYERGVEDETLSCGTGVTAVAIAMHHSGNTSSNELTIETLGGSLKINFDHDESYSNIVLTGPAELVFTGQIVC